MAKCFKVEEAASPTMGFRIQLKSGRVIWLKARLKSEWRSTITKWPL